MTEDRTVVVTGIGAVTAYGSGVDALWSALVDGRSAVSPITSFDPTPFTSRIAGEITDYTPPMPPQEAARLDRGTLFAIDAAQQALTDAALPITPDNAVRAGLVVGSARPGEDVVYEGQRTFHERGIGAMRASYISRTVANASAGPVASALGVRGPTIAISTAGASGTAAIDTAALLIRSGRAEVAFAVGCEAPITPASLAAFGALDALSKRNDDPPAASRPFDADADGFVLAEAGAALLLEDESLARERGARIYGRLAGSSNVIEPNSSEPSAAEAGRAIASCLHEPGILQQEIDYFCAHAPGIPQLDRIETDAIKRIFGELTASKLTLSAPKSMLGHTLGAAGVLEAIVCLKAIESNVVPPTINLASAAEGCDLDYTAGKAVELPVQHAMSYGYGLGGHHMALCFATV